MNALGINLTVITSVNNFDWELCVEEKLRLKQCDFIAVSDSVTPSLYIVRIRQWFGSV